MNSFETNAVEALAQLVKLANVKITKQTLTKALFKHPNFPSLASLKDVLTDCKIKTVAARGSIEKLAGLPLPSLVFLTIDGGIFAPVRKVTEDRIEWLHTQQGWQNDSLYEFEQKWNGAILLIEPTADSDEKNYLGKRVKELLGRSFLPFVTLWILTFMALLLWNRYALYSPSQSWGIGALVIIKLVGAGLSGVLIWQSVNAEEPVIRQTSSSFYEKRNNRLLKSKGAKLFGWVTWAELGLIYFTGSALGICVAAIFGEKVTSPLLLLNLISLPFTLYLIHYQVVKVKSWCLICCSVLVLFWLEFVVCYSLVGDADFSGSGGYLLLVSYLFTISMYALIKPVMILQMQWNDVLREMKRVKFNPGYVEGVLKNKAQLPPIFENMKAIGVGDLAASHTITLVYSPSNKESAELHNGLQELFLKKSDIYWRIIFLPTSEQDVQFIQAISNCPEQAALKHLNRWFTDIEQPYQKWKDGFEHGSGLSDDETKAQVALHANWCNLAKIAATPSLFVDGALIPAIFQPSDIPILLNFGKNKMSHSSNGFPQYLSKSEITVVLNIWKRDHIKEQLSALFNQTLKPAEIWVVQCGNYVQMDDIKKQYPFIQFMTSSVNLKYFGRFSLAQYTKSRYVYILDDDVIPSSNWLEQCKTLSEQKNVIIASAGRIIPKNDFYPEELHNVPDYFVGDVNRNVPYNYCASETKVDFGCNSWFLKSEWLKDFWRLPPYSFETGEDIHLSAACKIISNVSTIVPAQINEGSNGNLKKWYGHDELASWKKSDFLPQRADILKNMIENYEWKPILWS